MWSTLNKYLNIDIRSNNIILIVYVSFWCEARVQISSVENSHSWKESNKGLSQNGGHFLFFSPEIWWFEKRFHSLTNSDGSVSVSLLLTQQCIVTPFVWQEATVHGTHKQVLREERGLHPDQHEPWWNIQWVWCQRGQTEVSARLTEACLVKKTREDGHFSLNDVVHFL